MDKYDEIGDLSIRTALKNVKKILDEATKNEKTFENILKEIRNLETELIEFVPEGTAGALRFQVKRVS